jgi:HEAT repeat protein
MSRPVALMAACAAALMAVWPAGCRDPNADLNSPDSEVCREALRECAKSDADGVVERVAEVVAHDDTMVAVEAVRALGSMRTARAVEILGEVASGGRDKRNAIRQEAVIQLGRQQEAEVLEVLRKVVKVDPDPRVRAAAVTSIAWQRSLKDVPLLVEVAETETDRVVQTRAVRAVEQLVSLGFGYDPASSAEERKKAIERMRRKALTAARSVYEWRERRRQQQ